MDGLRLDVANEISHVFCKELRTRMKAIKPDIYILGEIWHDAMPWLRGDEFDAVMNYPLGESIKDFWIDKGQTNEDFEYTINRCYTGYMQQTNDVLFNLLDSHDPDCRRCMPWELIEAGDFRDRMEIVKSLIHLRTEEPLLRNRNFHFPNKINRPRVIEFMKVAWENDYVEVIITCEAEDVEVPKEGEVVFQRHYIDNVLLRNGILIRRVRR